MKYPQVFMVQAQVAPVGAWIGQSIHLTEAEAVAAMPAGGRVTPYIVSDPVRTVRLVSARLRGEHKRGLPANAEQVAA
jgi:hypothetical protein